MHPSVLILILLAAIIGPVTSLADSPTNSVAVRLIGPDGGPGPVTEVPRVVKTDAEWKKQLGSEAYHILRAKGTEAPFCGNLLDNHRDGVYFCAGCGLPLFSSGTKFQSGTGWPSFYRPFASENITELRDVSFGMVRSEILCTRCGGHLGHVFDDGPAPTGLRYCLNSESLLFLDQSVVDKLGSMSPAEQAQAVLKTAPAPQP
jgi:methionine-R-sulfoxide reductase